MKNIVNKIGLVALGGVMLGLVGCEKFLTTVPKDALSPATTWKTETDAKAFLNGIYNNAIPGTALMADDDTSDFGFNNHTAEGRQNLANGNMSSNYSSMVSYYDYTAIQRCNVFLDNIDNVEEFAGKKDMIAQVRAIRAFRYMEMAARFGDVALINFTTDALEAQVPRDPQSEVISFINSEIDAALTDINEMPSARGYLAKGAVLAIKMRAGLYFENWQRAQDAASAIMAMNKYSLDPSFANVFTIAGQGSSEIILARYYIAGVSGTSMPMTMYPNSIGGWSSHVPTNNLVDAYEMSNGLTKDETGSGYNPEHPFANRDPRMAMTILYPGANFNGKVFNTLDKLVTSTGQGALAGTAGASANSDLPDAAANMSKTALNWGKYLFPREQYPNYNSAGVSPILFRYAEVLLSFAEAKNELTGPAADVYAAIDQVRERVGMPKVDQAKYGTKETLRELIRRERGVELAGEGTRRFDILRWKDASGKMVAETVLNGPLYRYSNPSDDPSFIAVDASVADPTMRATIKGTYKIEDRKFEPHMRYYPIPQSSLERNPQLKQNPGY